MILQRKSARNLDFCCLTVVNRDEIKKFRKRKGSKQAVRFPRTGSLPVVNYGFTVSGLAVYR